MSARSRTSALPVVTSQPSDERVHSDRVERSTERRPDDGVVVDVADREMRVGAVAVERLALTLPRVGLEGPLVLHAAEHQEPRARKAEAVAPDRGHALGCEGDEVAQITAPVAVVVAEEEHPSPLPAAADDHPAR